MINYTYMSSEKTAHTKPDIYFKDFTDLHFIPTKRKML